jgi:hypothetical protein
MKKVYRFAVYHDGQLREMFETESAKTFYTVADSWQRKYRNFTRALIARMCGYSGWYVTKIHFSAESRDVENLGDWERV